MFKKLFGRPKRVPNSISPRDVIKLVFERADESARNVETSEKFIVIIKEDELPWPPSDEMAAWITANVFMQAREHGLTPVNSHNFTGDWKFEFTKI